MADAPTPAEIRKARAFLQKRNISTREISPRRFAASAKEMDKTFHELLQFIMRLYQGQQNQAAQRRELLVAGASK